MSENTARELFLHNDTITKIVKNLDVSVLKDFLLTSPDSIILSIDYWEQKRLQPQATLAIKENCNMQIAKLEALLIHMSNLSCDIYEVPTSMVDAVVLTPDLTVEAVLVDIADKSKVVTPPVVIKKVEPKVIVAPTAPVNALAGYKATDKGFVIIDNEGKETELPTMTQISAAARDLLKKGNYDSAHLLAANYLVHGKYVPKEGKKVMEWTDEKVTSWLKDVNTTVTKDKKVQQPDSKATVRPEVAAALAKLPDAKGDSTPPIGTEKPKETTEKNSSVPIADNVAATGFTITESDNLKLLDLMIPPSAFDKPDATSRRKRLNEVIHMSSTLEKEQELLNYIARKITAVTKSKMNEAALAGAYSNIDKFCTLFFAKRNYTTESIKAWRNVIRENLNVPHFEYLKVDDAIDPNNLAKCETSYEDLLATATKELGLKKTHDELYTSMESKILYKMISNKDNTYKYNVYTKLHARDFVDRVYTMCSIVPESTVTTEEPVHTVELPETTIPANKEGLDVSVVKKLLVQIAENGGEPSDAKSHPEILSLLGRKITIDAKAGSVLKFDTLETLQPWIIGLYSDIRKLVLTRLSANAAAKASNEKQTTTPVVEKESMIVDLDNLTTLCHFAASNDVSQEDFIKEHKDLVISKEGKYKTLKSTNGTSTTSIGLGGAVDFAKWVAEEYQIITDRKAAVRVDKPSVIDTSLKPAASMSEVQKHGMELLKQGITYEKFMEWMSNSLLDKLVIGQKPNKIFKTLDAVKIFAINTFGKNMPKPTIDAPVDTTAPVIVPDVVVPEAIVPPVIVPTIATEKVPLTLTQIKDVILEAASDEEATVLNLTIRAGKMCEEHKIKVVGKDGKERIANLQDAYTFVQNAIEEVYPEMMEAHKKKLADSATKAKDQLTLDLVEETPATTATPTEIVEPVIPKTENAVFEKVDMATKHPEIWAEALKFTNLDEVLSLVAQHYDAGKFNEALSLSLDLLPRIEASKTWNVDMIKDWFDKYVIPAPAAVVTSEVKVTTKVAPAAKALTGEIKDSLYADVSKANNRKHEKNAVTAILALNNSEDVKQKIVEAYKKGNNSYLRQLGKNSDKDLIAHVNNLEKDMLKIKE